MNATDRAISTAASKLSVLFRLYKTTLILFLMFCFIGQAWLTSWIVWDTWKFRRRIAKTVAGYSKLGLKILGFKVYSNYKPEDFEGSHLIVSNHLSYMDILMLTQYRPACFVTSQEVRETPVLGQICYLAGCVFVERRNKQNIHQEIREITEALSNGLDVSVFPEATSTNGEQILRFRRPLYNAALDSGRPVMPMTINYLRANEEIVHQGNRDTVFWYGDMDFISSLWALAGLSEVTVEITFHDPIDPQGVDLPSLVDRSYQAVASQFIPIPEIG